MAILQVENLTKTFGGVVALDDVSFEVADHRITALIGPNGAGKTTLFNVVAGTYRPTRGAVRLAGQNLNGLQAPDRVRLGIGRTFQNALLFDNMTVIENVMMPLRLRLYDAGELLAAVVASCRQRFSCLRSAERRRASSWRR